MQNYTVWVRYMDGRADVKLISAPTPEVAAELALTGVISGAVSQPPIPWACHQQPDKHCN